MYCSIGEVIVSPIGDSLDWLLTVLTRRSRSLQGLMNLKAKKLFRGFLKLKEKPHCFGDHSLSKPSLSDI